MPSTEELDKMAKEEERYYDALYNFAKVAVSANDMALDGYTTNQIAKKLQQSASAFYMLCNVDEVKAEKPKKIGRPKKEPDLIKQPPEPEQVKEEPAPLPDNFIKDDNGWGLCPVCRKKMVRLTNTTKLVDFPAYCKACRSEYLVSWWNVEDKEIEYKRYINDKQYIDRRNIRSEGMKGTGVKGFLRTRTSATERVAMHL